MRIYYNKQCIYFAQQASEVVRKENLTNAWIIRNGKSEDYKNIFLDFVASNFDSLIVEGLVINSFAAFAKHFFIIQAAGGVVWNENNELLMIHRLGKWDLPKGKLDLAEEMALCAVREVQEETGLQEILLSGFLKATYHMYAQNGEWILKHTEWYELHAPEQILVPQAEEDITQAVWVPKKDIINYLENSYPNIVFLLRAIGCL